MNQSNLPLSLSVIEHLKDAESALMDTRSRNVREDLCVKIALCLVRLAIGHRKKQFGRTDIPIPPLSEVLGIVVPLFEAAEDAKCGRSAQAIAGSKPTKNVDSTNAGA